MATRALGNPSSTFSLFTNSNTTHFCSRLYASNIAHDSVTQFEKLVQTRCQSRDLSVPEALGYFNSILEMRPMPSIWTLNQLLGSLSKSNNCSTVVSFYTHLTRSRPVDFDPDISTLNILIKCLCRLGRVELGFSVLGAALKRGIEYNPRTLDTLLDGLCRRGGGGMEAAAELFETIRRETGECSVVTYGTLINGFCKAREPLKALSLLMKMLNNDRGAKPDPYCFNSVVDSLCKEGLVDESLRLFRAISGKPDVVGYTALIRGLCKSGRHDEAVGLVEEMLTRGIAPSLHTYTVLMDLGGTREAAELFEEMISRGVAPNIFCYNTLIVGLTKSGDWGEVARVLGLMKSNGVSPNIVTLNSILDARFKEGSSVAALNLVRVMAKKGLFSEVISSSFLDGLCLSGRSEEAEILFGSMENTEIVVDEHTLNIILSGLATGFMMLESRRLLEDMIGCDRADPISFNTVINGYCLQGEMSGAEEVFGWMEKHGSLPNVVTYNILASGYLKVGRIGDALRTLKGLVVRGLRPDDGIRNVLKTVHAYRHELELDTDEEAKSL